jgi:hypothetical protein
LRFKDGEVIIDEVEKDIRIRIKDNIIKIVYNDKGLKEILLDDIPVYESIDDAIEYLKKKGEEEKKKWLMD